MKNKLLALALLVCATLPFNALAQQGEEVNIFQSKEKRQAERVERNKTGNNYEIEFRHTVTLAVSATCLRIHEINPFTPLFVSI